MRGVTRSLWIADFRSLTFPEVATLGADQKERGRWGRYVLRLFRFFFSFLFSPFLFFFFFCLAFPWACFPFKKLPRKNHRDGQFLLWTDHEPRVSIYLYISSCHKHCISIHYGLLPKLWQSPEIAFQLFALRLQPSLHVIVSWSTITRAIQAILHNYANAYATLIAFSYY